MTRALICGVTGQDGAYLAKLLLERGYEVTGTSRDANIASFANLKRLGIDNRLKLVSMAPTDFRSVFTVVSACDPAEIYALAGQSSVGLSFEMPAETLESMVFGTLNLLEAIRLIGGRPRLYHASSSECFGDLDNRQANENTPFRPRSPYGVAKTSAHLLVSNYREAYGLFAANGILFNHESPLRPTRFVTRKITASACRIANGSRERLRLGRLDIARDWGWAPEYVEAMWLMLQQEKSGDFIVATGETRTLAEFVDVVFSANGLDWREHVDFDSALGRPSDLAWSGADPGFTCRNLGWQAALRMADVARAMVAAEDGAISAHRSC